MKTFRLTLLFLLVILFSTFSVKAEATSFSSPGLNSSYPIAIAAKNGVVWVANAAQAKFWNGASWVNISIGYSLTRYRVTDAIVDENGRLWVSIYDQDGSNHRLGYADMSAGTWTVIESNKWYSNFFRQTDSGDIWAALESRACKFNGNGFTQITSPFDNGEGGEGNIGQFTVDLDGVIWRAGDYIRPAIYYWNGSSWISSISWPMSNVSIGTMATSADGTLIAGAVGTGTSKGWAEKKLNGSWVIYNGSHPFNDVLNVALDGTVWGISSSNNKCLNYYKNSSWYTTIGASAGIQNFDIDDNGIIWAVLGNGSVAAYLEGTWFTDTTQADSLLIQAAKKAADEAKLAASHASAYANTAATNSGNAYSSASTASINAANAYSAASTAITNAANAYSAASSANSYSQQSVNILNGTSNGGKSLSATYDKSNIAATQATNAANNTAYAGQSVAYMTNMISYNIYPSILKVQGKDGSTCTTGNSYTILISSNPSTNVSYRITCNTYDSGWVTNNSITINSGITNGANTATIKVRNNMGNEAATTITFFKL